MNECSKKKYLFKCQDCSMILSVEFETEEDHQKVNNDEMILECLCEGYCKVLRD